MRLTRLSLVCLATETGRNPRQQLLMIQAQGTKHVVRSIRVECQWHSLCHPNRAFEEKLCHRCTSAEHLSVGDHQICMHADIHHFHGPFDPLPNCGPLQEAWNFLFRNDCCMGETGDKGREVEASVPREGLPHSLIIKLSFRKVCWDKFVYVVDLNHKSKIFGDPIVCD